MKRSYILLASLLCVLAPLPAFGAEGEEAGVFAGDIGNALWTLVIFGLVVYVLGRFAWKPILNTLQAREDFIHAALAEAKRDRDEAEGRLKEYAEKLTAARAEASKIVEEGRRDAEALKHKIEDDAKVEAGKLIERAKREIGIAKDTAIDELYAKASTLATAAAARILRKELNPKDHERLIQDAIAELGNRSSN